MSEMNLGNLFLCRIFTQDKKLIKCLMDIITDLCGVTWQNDEEEVVVDQITLPSRFAQWAKIRKIMQKNREITSTKKCNLMEITLFCLKGG